MECPVCFEPYNLERHRPKVLVSCGHSVCKKCLLDPGFGRECPQDRTPIQGELAQLPDSMAVINIIVQGNTTPRSSVWCRDCEKDSTDDCLDAGHRVCSQRQLRAERIASHAQAMEMGAAAGATLEQHLDAMIQDVQRHLQASRADQRHFQETQAKLEAAAKAVTGLQQAMEDAELLLPRAERLGMFASLAGLRGRCSVVVQAQDGAEWRASVALEDGKQRALRHALLELRNDGELTEVDEAAGPTEAASAAEGHSLDMADIRPAEMNAGEIAEFLQRNSLKQVRSLTGVDCSQGPRFCELLLEAVAPHLEELEMKNPSKEHTEWLKALPFLRKLSMSNSNKEPVAEVSEFPVNLEELCIKRATLEHMKLVKDLTALRKLEVICQNTWANAPDLPLQLEDLAITNCSEQHASSIQRMPRLRRLCLASLRDIQDFAFPQPPRQHCGLSYLKIASGASKPILSLIRVHAATLREIQLLRGSSKDSAPYLEELPACLRECAFPNLQRLVLLRSYRGWRGLHHTAEACRQQVRELQDALLRRDAAGGVQSVPVVCEVCDEGAQH